MSPTNFLLTDVTLRDGIQSEKPLSLDEKLQLFQKLIRLPFSRIEITSFVNPKWIPQFSDSEEFCKQALKSPKIECMAFVPNERGLERLLLFPISWAGIFIATSESFNKKNVNASIEDTLQAIRNVIALAHKEKRKVRVYVSTAFGCPYEGIISQDKTLSLIEKINDLQPDEIAISDTIGVASPQRVTSLLNSVLSSIPPEKLALHLHNTYGMALSCIAAAMPLGITKFDGSTGGIGGCPYAKGASGNLASEEILYSLFRDGLLPTYPAKEFTEVWALLSQLKLDLHSSLYKIHRKGAFLFGVN